MDGASPPPGQIPHNVAVRSKGLLLYDTGDVDRKEFQVVRTRQCSSSTSLLTSNKKDNLKNEREHRSGARDYITAESLEIRDAAKDLLHVVVGVLLLDAEVQQAENLANSRPKRMAKIQDYNKDIHGATILLSTTDPIRVVTPIWPAGDGQSENAHERLNTCYFILCNLKDDGLCEALPLAGGIANDNLFFYPEWTRDGTDIIASQNRRQRWSRTVKEWCADYRQKKDHEGN